VINRAPVYCDIGTPLCIAPGMFVGEYSFMDPTATRLQIALNSAVPACSLCIQRRLYKCTTMTTGGATREEKRRDIVVDLLIGIGIPILQIAAGNSSRRSSS
jgi:Pheromone A receptor